MSQNSLAQNQPSFILIYTFASQLVVWWSRLGLARLCFKSQVESTCTFYVSHLSWTKKLPGAFYSPGNGKNVRGMKRNMQWLLKTKVETSIMSFTLAKANYWLRTTSMGQRIFSACSGKSHEVLWQRTWI